MRKTSIFVIFFILIIFPINGVFAAEPIKITISGLMDEVIFDGKWTSGVEWKQSSWDSFSYGDHLIHLRSAHQDNFIYFLVDFQTDNNPNDDLDKTMICLDTKNDKTAIPDEDDFCFLSILNGDSMVFQGTSDSKSHLKEIPKPVNFLANGTVTDENDRYSKIPHTSYEFKIPTDFVGRYSEYGFFLVVYDEESKTIFNWPPNPEQQTFENLKPAEWGELVSLDKTLPEFHEISIMVLGSSIVFVVVFARKFSNLRKINNSIFSYD